MRDGFASEQNEGSCNAIVEAASCGLPIISSDLPFNDDLLTEENSMRIDPNSVREIKTAIELLYNDSSLRAQLTNKIYDSSQDFRIERRCEKIMLFLNKIIKDAKEA